MELNEAARRILRGHWIIITALALVGLVIGYLIQGPEKRLCLPPGAPDLPVTLSLKSCHVYYAAARLQIDTDEPKSANEAEAVADASRAIASSPSHVAAALAKIDALRDPSLVAKYGVRMSSLGLSGIGQLSVVDRDPKVAAALANALADDVVQTRSQIHRAELVRQLADIDAAVTERANRIAEIDKQLEDISKIIIPPPPPTGASSLRLDPVTLLQTKRGDLVSERQTLLSQRLSILAGEIGRPKAAIVEDARPPTSPQSSNHAALMGLGLLLGLILGVGIAAMLEAFRPTIIGRASVARAVGAPTLGHLTGTPQRLRSLDFTMLGARLRLAAHAAHVGTIELVPADPAVDVAPLAEHLQNQLGPPSSPEVGGEPANGRYLPMVRPLGAASLSPEGSAPGSGLVVVVPDSIKKSELTPVSDVLTITNWPVLGVVTYTRQPFWSDWGRNGSPPAATGPRWHLPLGAQGAARPKALQESAPPAKADAAAVVRSIYQSEVPPGPSERQPPHGEDRKGA